ncbi:DUF4446 family protein [Chakrabartyella piscis]|uniref:DUF4446 family protein n=1 Tax=Chakrabartyella piscis TaxID=2918914 RepID=UPI002958BFD3|nr:DUF4446 family protein [Chakrabartyella piscis]
MSFLTDNLDYVLLGFGIAVLIMLIFCIVTFVYVMEQKKKYEFFMGSKRRPSHNLEMKLEEYFRVTKQVEENYNKVLDMVLDIEENMRSNVQKVGLVRYNPFDEMGGNLCFALALLDQDDNGVVLNGIHSRTGSFTYAKPIQMGVSIYLLSDEEIEAVEVAKNQTFKPKHEKIMKIKFRKKFKKYDNQEKMVPVVENEDKKMEKSLGDVTHSEREQIQMEEQLAGKIASVDAINEDYYDEMYPDASAEELMAMDVDVLSAQLENSIASMEQQMGHAHSDEELHDMAKKMAAILRMEEVKRKKDRELSEEEEALSNTNLRRKVRMEKRVLVEETDEQVEIEEKSPEDKV